MSLSAGDWVEVRSKEEILRSLDSNGRLDGLPFMPQMFAFCGRRLRVYRSAHKTCDTVNGTGGRTLVGGVHLENARCDGKAYGGCQAACLMFWKEAWLKPVDFSSTERGEAGHPPVQLRPQPVCTEDAVLAGTLARDQPAAGGPRYSCQATDLPVFTTYLPWWDARQYVKDVTSGNVSLGRVLSGAVYGSYYYFVRPGHDSLRKPFRWVYDRVVGLWGGIPFPRKRGTVPFGQPTPNVVLDLRPGELVRVKSYEDILATIDESNKNRGLFFDAEMVPFCGKTFRVKARITRFIGENTGRMINLKTPAIMLENVWCQACYSDRRMHCPRSIYSWWREGWLERVESPAATGEDGVAPEKAKSPVAA